MITRESVSRMRIAGLIAASVFFSAETLFAQVKIGAAPTTIGANSNLEVEAANNKKVIVHKSDGTVVIENVPSGAVTDSIMTVNVSGDVRAINAVTLKKKLGMSGSGSMVTGGSQSFAAGAKIVPNFTTTVLDEEGSIDLVNDLFTVRVAGIYTISSTIGVLIPGTSGQSANVSLLIQKNVSGTWVDIGRNNLEQNSTFVNLITVTMAEIFSVGDRIRVQVLGCSGCIVGNPNYTLASASLFVTKTN